jgi:hypothetical protein
MRRLYVGANVPRCEMLSPVTALIKPAVLSYR